MHAAAGAAAAAAAAGAAAAAAVLVLAELRLSEAAAQSGEDARHQQRLPER